MTIIPKLKPKYILDNYARNGNIKNAITIGIVGTFIVSMLSSFSRIFFNHKLPNEFSKLFIHDLSFSIGLYFFLVCGIYIFSFLLKKGKKNFEQFLISFSYGGIYSIIINILWIPLLVSIITDGKLSPSFQLIINMLSILSLLTALFLLLRLIRYHFMVLQEVLKLGFIRSFTIWLIVILPFFFFYVMSVGLTGDQMRQAGIGKGMFKTK